MRPAIIALVIAVWLAPTPAGAQKTDPNALAQYRAGLQLMSAEHWDEAADSFSRAIDIDPRFALAHYWLGRARIAGRRYVAAIAALETSGELYLQEMGSRASDQIAASQRRQEQLREIREMIRERQGGRQTAANERVMVDLERLASEIERQQGSASIDFRPEVPAFVR